MQILCISYGAYHNEYVTDHCVSVLAMSVWNKGFHEHIRKGYCILANCAPIYYWHYLPVHWLHHQQIRARNPASWFNSIEQHLKDKNPVFRTEHWNYPLIRNNPISIVQRTLRLTKFIGASDQINNRVHFVWHPYPKWNPHHNMLHTASIGCQTPIKLIRNLKRNYE